jgi:hypothetical protein
MGYMHINNLYKDKRIMMFRECYALEKVHGTSAHVSWKEGELRFFSGGASLDTFVALFDRDKLKAAFEAFGAQDVTVYGEAYGGKMQGMRETYGEKLAFIAFDMKVGEHCFFDVPRMAQFCEKLGFEVVPWELTSTDAEALNALRDRKSEVAVRRGCGADKEREGVVLRPLMELRCNNGERIICKHKGDAFEERARPPKVTDDPEKLAVLTNSAAIADEWVVPQRLTHVLDHLLAAGMVMEIRNTPKVMEAMVEDVFREAKGEIVESKETKAAIGRKAAGMFHQRLKGLL